MAMLPPPVLPRSVFVFVPILAGLAAGILLLWGNQAFAGAALGVVFAVAAAGFFLSIVSIGSWRQRRWFNSLFYENSQGYVLVSGAGKMLTSNPSFQQLLSRSILPQDSPTLCFPTVLSGIIVRGHAQANRLHELANIQGTVDDILSLDGINYRVTVTSLTKPLAGFLWQFTSLKTLTGPQGREASVPMVNLASNGQISDANGMFTDVFGVASQSPEALTDGAALQVNTHQTLRTKTGKKDFLIIQNGAVDRGAELYFFETSKTKTDDHLDVDIFYNLPVAMLKMTSDGRILACNRVATLMLGPRLSSFENFEAVFRAGSRSAKAWLEEALERPPLTRWDFLQLNRDDQEVILQVALTKAESTKGEATIFAALTDVTELKSLELQFVHSQKMQAIGQLAGGVAHDFNNLLTAISGHCDLLLLKHDTHDPNYSDLMQIHLNANRAASLVGQLLAFSRKQTLQLETINLRDSLSDLAHLLNRLVGERIELQLRHHPTLSPVRADKRQLEQVIMNLVVNARDAMPNGGVVKVETDKLAVTHAIERENAIVPAGEYVLIKVIDEGVGIRPDQVKKVFEPFYSTKKPGEGTGLGLSTAYGIVKQSGGFLFVESDLGEGSCFEVMLPAGQEEEVQAETMVEDETAPMTSKRSEGVVLLVEDEAPVRAFASRVLQMKGFHVIEADSGEAALETLAETDLEVDLFVTDMIMPGMDGPTWVEKARENDEKAKVLFMSGYAADSLKDKQAKFPEAEFLAKPFSLQKFSATVERIMS